MKCTYKPEFGQPRPPGVVRARLEQFDAVLECIRFEADGAVAEILPVEAMRAQVERRWASEASGAVLTDA